MLQTGIDCVGHEPGKPKLHDTLHCRQNNGRGDQHPVPKCAADHITDIIHLQYFCVMQIVLPERVQMQ